jgi:hypothetical protein
MNTYKEIKNLDYKDFINLNQHIKKIDYAVKKIQKAYGVSGERDAEINDIYDYFLDDIRVMAKQLYADIRRTHHKIKPQQLKNCIEKGTAALLENYENIIGRYYIPPLSTSKWFQNIKTTFIENAKEQCKSNSQSFYNKYSRFLRKEKSNRILFWSAIIAAITGIVTVTPSSVTSYLYSQTILAIMSSQQNQISYVGSLVKDKKYQEMLEKDFLRHDLSS